MRKILLIGTLALAGCSTVPPLPNNTGYLSPLVAAGVITEDTRTKAKQVQAKAAEYCQYIPTLGTAISLVSASVGASVATLGAAICSAATTAPLADGGRRRVKVNGVVIKGKFVR